MSISIARRDNGDTGSKLPQGRTELVGRGKARTWVLSMDQARSVDGPAETMHKTAGDTPISAGLIPD